MIYKTSDKKRESSRRYYWENRERLLAHKRQERTRETSRHREYVRAKRDYIQARLYGLSKENYQGLLIKQQGVCAVCHEPEKKVHSKTGQPWSLCIDHDHVSGRVRGLLCSTCNSALGYLKDNIDLAKALVSYLESCAEVVEPAAGEILQSANSVSISPGEERAHLSTM